MEPWNTIIKLEANSTETVRCCEPPASLSVEPLVRPNGQHFRVASGCLQHQPGDELVAAIHQRAAASDDGLRRH